MSSRVLKALALVAVLVLSGTGLGACDNVRKNIAEGFDSVRRAID